MKCGGINLPNPTVVILTRPSALKFLGKTTVAPVTSVIRDIPSEVLLGKEDGLPRACAVHLDHIQTVAKEKIAGLIGTLNEEKAPALKSALLFSLEFKEI